MSSQHTVKIHRVEGWLETVTSVEALSARLFWRRISCCTTVLWVRVGHSFYNVESHEQISEQRWVSLKELETTWMDWSRSTTEPCAFKWEILFEHLRRMRSLTERLKSSAALVLGEEVCWVSFFCATLYSSSLNHHRTLLRSFMVFLFFSVNLYYSLCINIYWMYSPPLYYSIWVCISCIF